MKASLLHSVSRSDLEQALRILRDYRNAYKQIGKHAIIRDPRVKKDTTVRVQFAVPVDQADSLMPFVEKALEEYFPEAKDVSRALEYNPALVGGIRVFYGDDMVDISFDKYAHTVAHSL